MKEDKVSASLPGNYFDGKDGSKYRFTILKDIAVAGNSGPVAYDDSRQKEIFDLYGKYKDFAIYVHYPWCIEHCSYCHYYRGPMLKKSVLQAMLEAEKKHALMMDEHIGLQSKSIRSIYFGGGTPTVLPADLLDESMGYYVERYGGEDCEVCLEASPLTLKAKKIDILEKYVTRLSVGVQSFDDGILKIMERKHTGEMAKEVVAELVPRFHSVNVDLIYGLYKQTLDDWLASVRSAVELKAQSLTIYRLDIREIPLIMKAFRREPEQFPDEQMCWRMYEDAKKILLDAGYRENLVGWFLLPQVEDTVVYRERWEKQSPCIAFGPALHNYAADHFYETLADHDEYVKVAESGRLPIKHSYPLGPKKQLVWYVLAQLKSNSPVSKNVIAERFGEELLEWFTTAVGNYVTWGVLIEQQEKLRLNDRFNYILEWMLVELIGLLD